MFKFIHAADVHLDSPLRGLDRYEGAPVEEIRQATRRALENLVRLAIDESAAFVLLAGDLYDGDWKDFHTGMFFVSQMVRLREAGIDVLLVAGNHDAANRMTKKLPLPKNVHSFAANKPRTVELPELDVAVHGQSFSKAAVTANLASGYPAAVAGMFNIGLLHTSATGREGHESYAPCSLDDLRSKGYDYWALGHVHQREVLCEQPPVIFPGNLQGRHIRETGAKGCTLVTVDDQGRTHVEPRPLDVFRWEHCHLDATGAETAAELLDRLRDALARLVAEADGRPLAVRVEIEGPCAAHRQIAATPRQWIGEVRAAAMDVAGGSVWIEKVKTRTSLPVDLAAVQSTEGPIGELIQLTSELKADPETLAEILGDELAGLRKKLPAELLEGDDAVDLDSLEVLRDALDQVEQMLVGQLLASEDAP